MQLVHLRRGARRGRGRRGRRHLSEDDAPEELRQEPAQARGHAVGGCNAWNPVDPQREGLAVKAFGCEALDVKAWLQKARLDRRAWLQPPLEPVK